jgi:hypothetical protein
VRPRACMVSEVRVLVRHALSGLKPNIRASPGGGVRSNGR